MMRPLQSTCPELSNTINPLTPAQLEQLLRVVILETINQFSDIDAIRELQSRLESGGAFADESPDVFRHLYEACETTELAMQETQATQEAIDKQFRDGRYLYALSLAFGELDSEVADNLLYDMGHAFDDTDAFWVAVLETARGIARKADRP